VEKELFVARKKFKNIKFDLKLYFIYTAVSKGIAVFLFATKYSEIIYKSSFLYKTRNINLCNVLERVQVRYFFTLNCEFCLIRGPPVLFERKKSKKNRRGNMSIFYVENENGTYLSQDGKRKFEKLTGKKAYEYLKSKRGTGLRFFKTYTEEEDGVPVYVQIAPDKVKIARTVERREQYVGDCKEDSGIQMYSFDRIFRNGEELSGEEIFCDENADVENLGISSIDIETLHKALASLSKEEFELINMLYLTKEPLTRRQVGELLGVSQNAIYKRKQSILKKLKIFF